jgi:cbb3-type cytochrome oxidase subunit 3
MQIVFSIAIFVVFIVGIWFSYRLFMRGNTPQEKVASLLPRDFKPDVSYRLGDTYVGYERAANRLVVVDWPHVKVLSPNEVVALKPVHESTLGLTHHWVAVDVPDAAFPRYRIWFQFRRAKRDEWLGQLAQICGK